FDQTFGLFGGAHGKSASTSLTNWLIGSASPPPHGQPAASATASPNGSASPQASANPIETIAPSPPKLTTAERQRIQAYVEKQIRHCVFSVAATCLSGGWHTHRYCTDAFRAQFCSPDWCNCCHPYNGPVHRDNHLLGASCSHRCFSVGRLVASHWGHGHFH